MGQTKSVMKLLPVIDTVNLELYQRPRGTSDNGLRVWLV